MRAASSPVVALWLWCRSGRSTVPPGLYTCQAGRQAGRQACRRASPAQPGHAEQKQRHTEGERKVSHPTESRLLSLTPLSAVSNSLSHFSALPLFLLPSPPSLNFHISKSIFFFPFLSCSPPIRRSFCPPRTRAAQHTRKTLHAAGRFCSTAEVAAFVIKLLGVWGVIKARLASTLC